MSSRTITMERLSQGSSSDMEMDFNDVFGGPPKRFSTHEVRNRHSFNDQVESEEDSAVGSWSEKPVFGAERRRYQGDEFYDDIFKGDEAYSSPRRIDRDPYGSTPDSRVLSPAWPLPPKSEPFGTSLPAQFSLPAKLTKAAEYPAFGSGASNGSLSRFSSQTRQQDNGSEMLYRQRSEEEKLDKGAMSNVNHFHFSIYKWAGKGVPLMTPLVRGKNLNPKESSRLERCLSSNSRARFDQTDEKFESWTVGSEKQDKENKNEFKEPDNVALEEPKQVNNVKNKVVPQEEEVITHTEIKNEDSGRKERDSKPLSVPLNDDQRGQEFGEINQAAQEKKSEMKVDKKPKKREADVNKNVKRSDVEAKINVKKSGSSRGIAKNRGEVQDEPSKTEEKFTKVGMKGKVQEFVKIFNNQETASVSKGENRSQSSRWRGGNTNMAEKETASTTRQHQTYEDVKFPSTNKTNDASQRVDQNVNTKEKTNKNSRAKPSIHQPSSYSTDQNSTSSFSEPIKNDRRGSIGSADDIFVVEELYQDQSKKIEQSNDTKALDAKIQQWSQGRKGNIRSLLSTLQLALWPESGWKAVPLVDLIEGSAVKRSYQKALLYLHPDKLQQKGAASHQKYIAEKVFDILQEAWDHFNSLGGI